MNAADGPPGPWGAITMKTYLANRLGAVIAAALCCLTLPGIAQAQAKALDTGGYLKAVEEITKVMSVADQCPFAGYTVSPKFADLVVYPVVAQAVKGGMVEDIAMGMMTTAYHTAKMDENLVTLDYKVKFRSAVRANDDAATQKALKEWFTYLDGKCAAFSKMPRFNQVITAPQESGLDLFSRIKMEDLKEE